MIGPAIEAWDASLNQWFSNLGAPVEDVVRLCLAAVFGGLVGIEREVRGRQAGFRTCLLVCVGSALVMLVSIEFARHQWKPQPGVNITADPARIAYGVMTGIGFLCAGVIVKGDSSIRGLTTAAGMWCVAAIGLSIGFGMYLMSTLATAIVVAALWMLDYLGNRLPKTHHRRLVVRCPFRADCVDSIVQFIQNAGVKVLGADLQRSADLATADIDVRVAYKKSETFDNLQRALADHPQFHLTASREF
ncbi:MAG: MgtC/SapB family protein [Anaerolineae bacterium]|nr:MgtC/SapB family protein [Phycisphaerae bacterium]